MKIISVTTLAHDYKKILYRPIPLEGIAVTRKGKVVAIVNRPTDEDKDRMGETVVAQAEETIKQINVDTFTIKDIRPSEIMLGMCSRCNTHGELVRKMHVNDQGVYFGKWLCKAKCYNTNQGANKLSRIINKETTFNSGNKDFGGSNEKTSF